MSILVLIFALLLTSATAEAEEHPLSSTASKQFEYKEYDAALLSYNQLIQEFPERKEGYFNRGLCLYKTDKFSEAFLDFSSALQIDSALVPASFLSARCLQRRGDLTEAMQVFRGIPKEDALIFSIPKRIKNYELAVFVSSYWYYMMAVVFIVIALTALAATTISGKNW